MALLTEEQREVMRSACMERNREKNHRSSSNNSKGKLRKGKSWNRFDGMLDMGMHHDLHSYDSEEDVPYWLVEAPVADSVEEFKARVSLIINEYFSSSNVSEAADELRDLGCPDFHHYFVKKLLSKALDQHDRDKEKAAFLLSALHSDVIAPQQLAKGFIKLLHSLDDLVLDTPDAVDTVSLFLARGAFDEILPPGFIPDSKKLLSEGSRGAQAVEGAIKLYSGAARRAEVEERWGGSSGATFEALSSQIDRLLQKFLRDGDESEACGFIRQMNVPFFHHEIVKRSIELAIAGSGAGALERVSSLLKRCSDEGVINSSQMIKGYKRVAEALPPGAGAELGPILSAGTQAGWLSSTIISQPKPDGFPTPESMNSAFKTKATAIIHEFFSSDDLLEVVSGLQDLSFPDKQALFVKRLVLVAMDRKSREKEMASALLASLHHELEFEPDQIAKGFTILLQSAEDIALDTPDAGTQLAFFLARGVYDNALSPFNLEEIRGEVPENSLGREIVSNAKSILSARHAGERILRCWGGGTGWAIEDAKDKVFKIVEEFEAGGDLAEACRCIRELNLPFFHHEIVKQVLDMAMEKQNDRVVELLERCDREGLITSSQMCTGFKRVFDLLDELALDVPNAEEKFWSYVEMGTLGKWLPQDFFKH